MCVVLVVLTVLYNSRVPVPKGTMEQSFSSTGPVYFRSSPRHVPFANDTMMPYGILLPGEQQFGQQNKPRAADVTVVNDTGSSNGGHVSDSMMIKTEAVTNSNCTELKDMPYIPRGNSNIVLPTAAAVSPTSLNSQSLPNMGQFASPVFQGLLDPKAQYHKSLAEHSRMEQAQRKQQEEASKQQQLYIQLLQQYSNQLPESTRQQAEMLQTLLTDPNMVNMLQHIFKGQPHQQEHSPTVVTSPSSVHQTCPPSAPPSYSPGPPSSSPAVNQTMFQYQSTDNSEVATEAFTSEVSNTSTFNELLLVTDRAVNLSNLLHQRRGNYTR